MDKLKEFLSDMKELYSNFDSEHKAMLKGAAIVVILYVAYKTISNFL